MPQNKDNIETNLKALPASVRKSFLMRAFGTEDYSAKVTELRRENPARPVIYAGAGTCGLAAGIGKTLEVVREYLKANKIDAEIVEVGCIGYCAVEPMLDIQLPGRNRVCFQEATADAAVAIMDSMFKAEVPLKEKALLQFDGTGSKKWSNVPLMSEHPFFAKQKRFVLKNCGIIGPNSIEEYVARGGYGAFLKTIHTMTPKQLGEAVTISGLRGRGGGGFPTGKKWSIALAQESDQKYIICNADEGDPGAFMDRAVIEGDPHRVLEGMAMGAYAIGASKAYVYIRAEYPLAVKNLKIAIEQARAFGLLGENIYGSGFDLEIMVKMGAGAFVCGEETALMHSIEGRRGMPRPRPPYPAVKGLFGKPTVINNVETFANVPEIMTQGPETFAAIGTKGSKGTKVFALSGKVNRTGLVEIPMGTTVREIVFDIGGGIENGLAFKAVQIGGPSGGCISQANIDIEVDYETLKSVGAIMGSGGLVVMDEKNCMVDVAKFFMEFIKKESCGKCIPCREGTKRMLSILRTITRSRKSEKDRDALARFQGIVELESLAQVIRETSLCALGQTAPNPVLSTLRWFRDEYEAHIFDRKCPAGACTEMLEFSIDQNKCKGCTMCARGCPTQAIVGKPKLPHYIVAEKCISCGNCRTVCKFKAVSAA